MDSNDHELDKLIQETQDIWKSLKNSGVEVKDSDLIIEDPDQDEDLKLDELDKIAHRMNPPSPALNENMSAIANHAQLQSPAQADQDIAIDRMHENELKSRNRTLDGLNLATPKNELSAFFLSEEPSKLSQIKFSTPNVKNTSKQTDLSSLPDTPFFMSPTLPVITNYTDLSSPTSTAASTKPFSSHQGKRSPPPRPIQAQYTQQLQQQLKLTPTHILPQQPESSASPTPRVIMVTAADSTQTNQKDDNLDHYQAAEQEQEQLDFSAECWREVNALLSKAGFDVLMKQHTQEFETMSSADVVCDRFKQILATYEADRQRVQDYDSTQHTNDELRLKNVELKNQLTISSEKAKDLQQEMKEIRQQNAKSDRHSEELLMNVKRQLEHCKSSLQRKNEEIQQLKLKLQQHIEKESVRRESVEVVFQSIHKRNSKKNNKKDQQQLDVMAMYEEERKKMQNEIKFLRKETRTLNDKLLKQQQEPTRTERASERKNAANVSFTASTQSPSDDEQPSNEHAEDDDDDDDDDDDNVVVMSMKGHRAKKEITKKIDSKSQIERTKDLHRLESQQLRETLDVKCRENDTLESDLQVVKERNQSLLSDLEKRPSYNEWTRLRNELNEMNKKLMEATKVASLRKYMDTRELIKRDKELHSLSLNVENLPVQIMKEILQDLCRTLSVHDVTVLVSSVQKIAKCVACVPVLEQYISKIVRVLLSSDHAPNLVHISKSAPKRLFDQVIPVLKLWVIELDKVSALGTFRAKVNVILKKRTIYVNIQKQKIDGDVGEDVGVVFGVHDGLLKLHEMVKQVEELVESEEYLLNSKECFDAAQKNLTSNPNDLSNRMIRHFQHIFSVNHLEGVFPKMNQVYLELNEMKNLLKTVKSILGLPLNSATNLCFKELQKLCDAAANGGSQSHAQMQTQNVMNSNTEASVRDSEHTTNPSVITKWNAILMEIQALLQCKSEDEIVMQCTELMNRCKEYDAVFPRVHNLINQLRITVNVEHAHQILPRVKELIAADN